MSYRRKGRSICSVYNDVKMLDGNCGISLDLNLCDRTSSRPIIAVPGWLIWLTLCYIIHMSYRRKGRSICSVYNNVKMLDGNCGISLDLNLCDRTSSRPIIAVPGWLIWSTLCHIIHMSYRRKGRSICAVYNDAKMLNGNCGISLDVNICDRTSSRHIIAVPGWFLWSTLCNIDHTSYGGKAGASVQYTMMPRCSMGIVAFHWTSIFVTEQAADPLLLCPDGFFGRLNVTSFTCPTGGKARASVQYTTMPRCSMGIMAFHWTSILVTNQAPDLLLCPDGFFGRLFVTSFTCPMPEVFTKHQIILSTLSFS